jgi:hypothetical protein
VTLSTGTVNFFSDIEGSTGLSQQHSDAMPALLARHNEILSQSLACHTDESPSHFQAETGFFSYLSNRTKRTSPTTL